MYISLVELLSLVGSTSSTRILNIRDQVLALVPIISCVLCSRAVAVFSVVRVGGWISNSLAVMTDSAHMLTDLGSFVLALAAFFLARLPPSRRFPFGWFRAGTFYDLHLRHTSTTCSYRTEHLATRRAHA